MRIHPNKSAQSHIPASHGGKYGTKNPNPQMIDFSSNVNPLGCHPGVKRYLKKQLDLISEYPDPSSSDLRANLAWFTGIRKKQIVVGNGATEIIYNFCKTFLNKKTPVLIFSKIHNHKKNDFWALIETKNNSLIIERDNFYILRSKEKIRIPPNMAGEMVPYDTGIGDFRVHYAGFFDPGFGDPDGSFAVLEVKTNEVPFLLEDGQTIARIKYEKLNKESSVVYGKKIKSNYQNQKLALSKHFI